MARTTELFARMLGDGKFNLVADLSNTKFRISEI